MIIEQLSSLTVKVSLSKTDLAIHDVDFDSLENNNKNTRELVASVINEVRINLGLDLYNEPLYIEAFSNINNGCILYISAVDNSMYDQSDEIVSEFIILETKFEKIMIKFAMDFMKYFYDNHKESILYYTNNIFRLILNITPEKYDEILDSAISHGLMYSTDKMLLAYTKEYYSCVFEAGAVNKLSGKLAF